MWYPALANLLYASARIGYGSGRGRAAKGKRYISVQHMTAELTGNSNVTWIGVKQNLATALPMSWPRARSCCVCALTMI